MKLGIFPKHLLWALVCGIFAEANQGFLNDLATIFLVITYESSLV